MQYPLADLAGDVGMVLQHNLIPGQGAGFISAEDVHRAEILNGVEVLHDDLCFDSFTAPRASVEVTIIGSISGVKPTATDSANSAASHQSPLV